MLSLSYASMVHAMDENVGRLLGVLEKLGIDDNTVVIFTSDNGGLSTLRNRKGYPTSNLPFRAGKGWCYEGGIRVPFIIRAPGITSANIVCNEPVYSCDFYPTILDLAGLPAMPEQHADGQNLVPLMQGGRTLNREAILWHYPHYHGSAWKPGAAIRAGDWKLIEFHETGKAELYNLKEDIGEKNNLSESHPEKKKELWDLMKKMQKEMDAKFPVPNPDWQ